MSDVVFGVPWVDSSDEAGADLAWGDKCDSCFILKSCSGAPNCECDNETAGE